MKPPYDGMSSMAAGGPAPDYRSLSLIALAARIARLNDRAALGEFHGRRTVFRLRGGPAMLLAEFVSALRATPQAQALLCHSQALGELACDLTVDKFTLLPQEGGADGSHQHVGPDCRIYFRNFLDRTAEWRKRSRGRWPLDEEVAAARMLQGQVVREFWRSCLEARRSCNPGRSRYAWEVDSGVIYVWLPRWMSGHARRAWLEANVQDPAPSRQGERGRVQRIVDERLGIPREVGLDEVGREPRPRLGYDPPHSVEQDINVHGLAKAIADEKAANIGVQRPAIQKLGQSRLRALILRIFVDLGDGCYEERRIAEAFGLSRPALSRFAGSRWQSRPGSRPPDLWVNVARTLAGHEPFAEAARAFGAWPGVEAALRDSSHAQEGVCR
jgi:hypothetical protein